MIVGHAYKDSVLRKSTQKLLVRSYGQLIVPRCRPKHYTTNAVRPATAKPTPPGKRTLTSTPFKMSALQSRENKSREFQAD